jgi:hypothetical protein
MALKCVTCGLLFRSRNELDWHVRDEHLEPRLPPAEEEPTPAQEEPTPAAGEPAGGPFGDRGITLPLGGR